MALPVNKRVLKILFILFVVAFCVYLVPRVAINFFYYPDDKISVSYTHLTLPTKA